MMSPALRIATRYLVARGVIAPDVQKIEVLLNQGNFDDALTALDTLLNEKLKVRVFPHSDAAHVMTEWVQALDKKDEETFMEVVDDLLSIRRRLLNTPKDRLSGEVTAMTNVLNDAKRLVAWLEGVMRGAEDEIKHGPFKVILTGAAEGNLDDALKTLDEAAAKIESKFPQVLYGKVYVRKDVKAEQSRMVAGAYVRAGDYITLSLYARPDRNSVHTLIHEFGHRYEARFIHGDDREKFIELSTVGDVVKLHFSLSERREFAKEHLARQRRFRDENAEGAIHLSERATQYFDNIPREERRKARPLEDKFWDGDESVVPALIDAWAQSQYGGNLEVIVGEDKLEPLYASDYGRTDWHENFAESFLAFVLGMPLPEPLERFMKSLR